MKSKPGEVLCFKEIFRAFDLISDIKNFPVQLPGMLKWFKFLWVSEPAKDFIVYHKEDL